MKAILLFLLGLAGTFLAGCESDLPRNPNEPSVAFGNNKFREDGNERPATLATDRDKTAW